MSANYEWERAAGGKRPRYVMREYRNTPTDPWNTRLVASLRLTSPKRRRWTLEVRNQSLWTDMHVVYLDRLDEQEALDAARVVIMGLL